MAITTDIEFLFNELIYLIEDLHHCLPRPSMEAIKNVFQTKATEVSSNPVRSHVLLTTS